MVSFFGDYDMTETVYIPFNTFSSDDPSASVTITDLAAADVEIHKDGGTTQRSSDAGVTVSIDFDSVTGNHMVSIDLSDNSDAGFYSAGSTYQVRMEGTTIDGATVNAWIGAFSIGRTLRPTVDGRTLDVTANGGAGIDWGNVENPTTAVDLSATDIHLCDTVTTNTDMVGEPPTAAAVRTEIDSNSTQLAAILADTNELQTDDIPGTLTTIDGKIDALNDPTAASIADAVWDEAKAGHAGAGTFGEECQAHSLSTEIAAQNDITAAEAANAVEAVTVEGSYDLGDLLRLIASAVLGDTENSGQNFRDLADTKNRFTVSISSGNRNITISDAS